MRYKISRKEIQAEIRETLDKVPPCRMRGKIQQIVDCMLEKDLKLSVQKKSSNDVHREFVCELELIQESLNEMRELFCVTSPDAMRDRMLELSAAVGFVADKFR